MSSSHSDERDCIKDIDIHCDINLVDELTESINSTRIAHDINDARRIRSRDVELEENVAFQDFHLCRKTLDGLSNCGFSQPSPVQLKALPLGRCGLDLIVQSKAGTGKTCVFTLIALEALEFNVNHHTQTLILCPTREIAIQIHEVVTHVGMGHKDLKSALCIGGIEVKQNRLELMQKNGRSSQIVVGTPGRIKQLIDLGILKPNQIELLVLDEADKLMDEQFKLQIDAIYRIIPQDRQIIVTSATYSEQLVLFLARYMHNPIQIRIGDSLSLEAIREYYIESKAGHSGRKTLEFKMATLKSLLNIIDYAKCFVFTNFQARAPIIRDNLNKDKQFCDLHGPATYICSELSQDDRIVVFNNFKRGSQKILVSTDVSARGIDIEDIDLVINFDVPVDNSTYYHRIGRAGRFGQLGIAISIVSSESIDRANFTRSIASPKIMKLDLSKLDELPSMFGSK